MQFRHSRWAAVAIAASFALAGCGGAASSVSGNAPSSADLDAVAALGGQEQYDRMISLYEKAVAAGETKVLIYGPEAASLTPHLQKAWNQVFPKIRLEGSQLLGPVLAERMRAENAAGVGIGDVVESGSSTVPGHEEEFAEIDTFAGEEIPDAWRGPKGVVAVGLLPFGFVYNPSKVSKQDLPKNWDDLLSSTWRDRMAIPDPTTGGVMFSSITAMLNQGIWTESDVKKLAALNPAVVPPTNFNGVLTSVAQGQKDGGLGVSLPQIKEALGKGAPVDVVFPLEKNNLVSGLYAGVMKQAPHRNGAELYVNWRLTQHGAQATAEYGMYSLIHDAPAPEGLPVLGPKDFLQPIPFDKLTDAYKVSRPVLDAAFAK